jgi:hypothetical protein
MPQLTDRTRIRTILEADRPWAVYALADLEPGFSEHSKWFGSAGDMAALALIYTKEPKMTCGWKGRERLR